MISLFATGSGKIINSLADRSIRADRHRWIPAYPRRLALAKYSQVCSRYSPCYGNNSYAVHTKTCTDCSISIPCGGGQDYNNNGCKETG